jgi:hypothetical protein
MKKYLFGLGAILVGAGLMFIFTHTEVSADDMKESHCEMHKGTQGGGTYSYCKIKDMTCVLAHPPYEGLSCVRGSMF